MKLKKIVFLPLLLVALVACQGGGEKETSKGDSQSVSVIGSQDSNNETSVSSEEQAKVIAKELANLRVATAFNNMLDDPITSIEFGAEVEAAVLHKVVDDNEVLLEDDRIDLSAEIYAKAKDLDLPTAQMAVTGSASFVATSGGEKVMGMEGDVGLYYVDDFAYINAAIGMFNPESGETESESMKLKLEAGPFPGLPDFDELPGEVIEDEMPIDIFDVDALAEILGFVGTVHATEKGGELTVRYEITQDDIVNVILEAAADELEGMTPAEIEEATLMLEEMLSEMFLIRKAHVTIVVSAAGRISGLALDVDIDVFDEYYDWDPNTDEYLLVGLETITIDATLGINLKLNEPVTITFPDFTDYELVEEFPEIDLF